MAAAIDSAPKFVCTPEKYAAYLESMKQMERDADEAIAFLASHQIPVCCHCRGSGSEDDHRCNVCFGTGKGDC